MRTLLTLGLLLILATPAHAAGGEPRGVYSGPIKVLSPSKQRCGGCKLRLVLSDDGLEVTAQSSLSFTPAFAKYCNLGRRYAFDTFGLIRASHRFSTSFVDLGTIYSVNGRATRTAIRGTGELPCERPDFEGLSFTFTLPRTGHVASTAGTVVDCLRAGEMAREGPPIYLVRQRDTGCGRAHAAVEALAAHGCAATCTLAGLACQTVAAGMLDPAAQTQCTRGAGDVAELTRLLQCTPDDLKDFGATSSAAVFATAAVPCAEAADAARASLFGGSGGALACAPADAASQEPESEATTRCADPGDPRRVVLVALYVGFA